MVRKMAAKMQESQKANIKSQKAGQRMKRCFEF